MTDNAGRTTPETPGGDRGDERLARADERALLGVEPGPETREADAGTAPPGDASPAPAAPDGGAPAAGHGAAGDVGRDTGEAPLRGGSAWPAVTVVLLTVAAWAPVVLTFLRVGIDLDPFAFRTDNVFWVLAIGGSAATMTLAAGASGLHPRAAGSGAVRIAAAAVTGAQLFVLAVIGVIQVLWDARPAIMAQTAYTVVALVLAAGAVVLALIAARADRRGVATDLGRRAPVIGLACVLLGEGVLTVGITTQFPGEIGIYLVSLLISALTAVATLTGLWLVGRGRPAAGWTGAAMLCALAVLSIGSMINVFTLVDLPLSHRVVETTQYLLYAAGAVTAVLAAREAARA
ncbi:hypothetical protein [Myceligenerans pegani]|uniref:Uncharacterized protein n=1 Tax=Myceligenerans pegani TaxID=2776917 RepID=A0ABR9N5Q7_9MICO|nr:hypothetical protein [Myceligenerans sp. TRM 65318]MBE1878511.1 hypothetical protein [Myceligenerans sp. TRM 65318]MBE3020782.1 hypothetical protein [Myceligenerans sp. TRM 65318]